MKRVLLAVLVGVLCMSLFAGCTSNNVATTAPATSTPEATLADSNATPTAETETQGETKTFVVGFDAEYPPFSYMGDDGNYTGFDLEMAKAVCDLLGWECEYVPIDWDAKDMELNSGSIDCIWSGFTINGREDDYAWTCAYVDNTQVILTGKDSGITTLDDLAGKIVGVQVGTSALELLQEGGECEELAKTFASLEQFNSYNTAFVELQAGSIDAIAIDIGVAKYQINSRGDDAYVILDEVVETEEYGVGFRVDDTELRDQVQDAILQLVENGTYQSLAEKYELSDMICLE